MVFPLNLPGHAGLGPRHWKTCSDVFVVLDLNCRYPNSTWTGLPLSSFLSSGFLASLPPFLFRPLLYYLLSFPFLTSCPLLIGASSSSSFFCPSLQAVKGKGHMVLNISPGCLCAEKQDERKSFCSCSL